MMIHNFDPTHFLTRHWQKSPCLIKKALNHPPGFISADELAGLSLEDEVESRIVLNNSPLSNSPLSENLACDDLRTGDLLSNDLSSENRQWQLLNGPFDAETFQQLPPSHWTLLVQTLDYWLPQVSELLELFKFIPRWRFDDVMVSYAVNAGGVGPHYDNYDVFLIQGEGERRWRVGNKGDITQPQTVIEGLKHLGQFEPSIDVIMQPGDMLYIPPETPHWGESIGESIGYSVGYRAPRTRDIFALLANYIEDLEEDVSCSDNSRANYSVQDKTIQDHSVQDQFVQNHFFQDQFFKDSYRNHPNYSNEIEPQLLDWARGEILKIADNQALIAQLLGQHLSTSKIDTLIDTTEALPPEKLPSLPEIKSLVLAGGINANWYQLNENIYLNIEGESFEFPSDYKKLIESLLSGHTVNAASLMADFSKVDFSGSLSNLVNKGYLLVKK